MSPPEKTGTIEDEDVTHGHSVTAPRSNPAKIEENVEPQTDPSYNMYLNMDLNAGEPESGIHAT